MPACQVCGQPDAPEHQVDAHTVAHICDRHIARAKRDILHRANQPPRLDGDA